MQSEYIITNVMCTYSYTPTHLPSQDIQSSQKLLREFPHLHDVTHSMHMSTLNLCIEHAMMRPVIRMHVECLMEILQTLQQSVTLETNVLGYMNTA